MSQHDYIISNDTGANVRSDLNNALGAIASVNSGATEPSTTYAYQLWMDTANNVLKMRNSANSAWYTLPISPVANNTVDINGGTIDGVTLGASSAITSLSVSGTSSLNGAVVINESGADVDFRIESDTVTNALFVQGSSGNVGIGTSSPGSKVTIADAAPLISTYWNTPRADISDYIAGGIDANFRTRDANNNIGAYIRLLDINTYSPFPTTIRGGAITFGTVNGNPNPYDDAFERMRIDPDGNLLVGQTTASTSAAGNIFTASGKGYHIVSGDTPLFVDRKSNDGGLVEFRRDQTVVGSIGTNGGNMYLGSPFVGLIFNRVSPYDISPYNTNSPGFIDNVVDLGRSAARFDDIYATNGTIQTSDRNEKQDIEELSEAEQRVAVACKGLMRKYRWKDSVAEKGDDARIHFGIIAQDLQDAFAAEGLDAGRYAMFISTTWWETQTEVPVVEAVEAQDAVYDDEGNLVSEAVEAVEAKEAYTRTDTYESAEEAPEGAVERTRLGVRYPELLAFIIAAI